MAVRHRSDGCVRKSQLAQGSGPNMDERLALRLLRRIMEWTEETATQEYGWVRLIARLKYDGYGDYVAGVRFAESLAGWLVQFDLGDRQTAYDFIKNRLVYYTSAEVNRLVGQLQPRFVEPILRRAAGYACSVPSYLVFTDPTAKAEFARRQRQTLYIGLSDGARIDILRRANAGVLANDQVVLATHIDDDKWRDLHQNLAKALGGTFEGDVVFRNVVLIDDFTASGTTFIRKKVSGDWTGKIYKFFDATSRARKRFSDEGKAFPLATDVALHVHHYISTTQARNVIVDRLAEAHSELPGWFSNITITEGLLLPTTTAIDIQHDGQSWALTERYYDHDIYEQLKEHLSPTQLHLKRGYADCALPVVLEHNCPNNALTFLWAETAGTNGAHPMRPLFPRRHRHS